MFDAILGAAGKLVGGLFDRNDNKRAVDAQERMAAQNIALQREFAQNGIQWKAQDARNAGIHPAFAMGANTTSFSPVSIGTAPSSNWSSTLGGMGADIGRAINSTRSGAQRDQAFTDSVQKLEIEGKSLDNDIKRASLASSVARLRDNPNPPFPSGDLTPHSPASKFGDVPRLAMGDGEFRTDRGISNVDDYTKRYGESADWWAGPLVMWRDYVANHGNPMPESLGATIRPGSYLDRFYTAGRGFKARFGDYYWRR